MDLIVWTQATQMIYLEKIKEGKSKCDLGGQGEIWEEFALGWNFGDMALHAEDQPRNVYMEEPVWEVTGRLIGLESRT